MQQMDELALIYHLEAACQASWKPICQSVNLPQAAFTILMYLANNPERATARDISKYRAIKPNMVSFHVDKLVQLGYVERRPIPEDRRQVRLVCTEKAAPLLEAGRAVQDKFYADITVGMTPEDIDHLRRCLEILRANAEAIQARAKEAVGDPAARQNHSKG